MYICTQPTLLMCTYLSLVGLGGSAVVKDAVTLSTQIATLFTEDQRLSFSVIVIVTQRLGKGEVKIRAVGYT